MDANSEKSADPAQPDDAVPTTPSRAEAYRERFRQSQAIAAQVARARAAGGQPSESEAARLVAEFHARGGKVTVYPQAEETLPAESGRGGRNGRG
jgi:hypothetical protein